MAFTVYKSSAGSGKTFTLVKEYLRIVLLIPSDFRHVLAITFTNKAANEMKERIVSALTEIARYSAATSPTGICLIVDQLHAENELEVSLMTKNAKRVLQYVLHEYSDFAISTIDSFVHRIIRSFAFDLQVPMNFDVELNAEELLQKAVDLLISEVGTNELLTRFLVQFIQSKMDDDKSWNIELDLLAQSKTLLNEDDQPYIEKLQSLGLSDFLEIEKASGEFIRKFENHLTEIGKKGITLIEKNGIASSAFYRGSTGIASFFGYFKQKRRDKFRPNSYVQQTIQNDKWFSAKAGASDIAAIESIKDELTALYHEVVEFLDKQEAAYILHQEVMKNLYPIAILGHIDRLLQEYKQENDILLISEFNRIIARVVLNEPVPFIYERVGEKYHHYLLDEFQDTSVRQWQNLLPLVDNALASGYDNLIVGDGKQAIYRWRSGEVEQFVSLPKIYKKQESAISHQHELALERNYKGQVLNFNYRSKQEIVQFNNSFFEFAGTRLGDKFSEMYREVVQQFVPGHEGGYVQLEFYDPQTDELDLETFNLERTSAIVEELFAAGYGHEAIAVLVRSNADGALVAGHLLEKGIPVISSESLLLEHSDKVRLLMALLWFVHQPDDKLSRLEILVWLVNVGRVKGSLHDLNISFGLMEASDGEGASLRKFYAGLASCGIVFNPAKLRAFCLIDMLEALIRGFQLMAHPDPYVQFFLDAVLAESAKKDFELADLLDWWELRKSKLSIVVPEGVNAVQVMTIHKSKGLEFPVVIYPFANDKLRVSKSKLWVDLQSGFLPPLKTALINTSKELLKTEYCNQYEEEVEKSGLDLINMTYVAFTRPAECLFVISSKIIGNSKVLSTPTLLTEYLNHGGLYNPDQNLYSFGAIAPPQAKASIKPDAYPLEEVISEDWKEKLQISLQAPQHWRMGESDEARQWGNLIHRILSEIKTKNDIEKTVDRFVSDGTLPEESKHEVVERLEAFINQKDVEAFFREDVKVVNEADILMPDGTIHRPDRIVFDKNGLTVVDYKTGKKKEEHIHQVQTYMNIMAEMGNKNVKGAVLYLNETSHEYIS